MPWKYFVFNTFLILKYTCRFHSVFEFAFIAFYPVPYRPPLYVFKFSTYVFFKNESLRINGEFLESQQTSIWHPH